MVEGKKTGVTVSSEPCATARVVEEEKPCVSVSSDPRVPA